MLKINKIICSVITATALIGSNLIYAAELSNNNDYLHTEGSKIVDSYGNEVRLTGISWFGFETADRVFHGLWSNGMDDILNTVANNGFNLLRIPLSVETINMWRQGNYPSPGGSINYSANSDLVGKNTLQILDRAIELCKEKGIKVMLDIHRIESSGQTNTWYTNNYSVEDYEASLEWLTRYYRNDDTVIAMDIFNEPHGEAKWDNSTDKNNWKYEAEKVGKKILDINPNLLIMVEGIEAANNINSWWGANLSGVKEYTVNIEGHSNQVVYSPHDYGPGVYGQWWFYDGFTKETLLNDYWYNAWYFIQDQNIAPILIGEWGGKLDGGKNQRWMNCLADLIEENSMNSMFWCVNPNSGDTGGILYDDFKTLDTNKYAIVKKTLWSDKATGKFIGLDHERNLGVNGTHVAANYSGGDNGNDNNNNDGNIGNGDSNVDKNILGDVNGDNKLNNSDYDLLKKYLLNPSTEILSNKADLNKDGKITVADLLMLKKLL